MRIRGAHAEGNGYAIFSALTHLAAAIFELAPGAHYLFFRGDSSSSASTRCASPIPIYPFSGCGILRTSSAASAPVFLDPVSAFFFRGEGCMKLAAGVTTLFLSKLFAKDSSVQATKFHAALLLSTLIASIPCWYLNTTPNHRDDETYFDADVYRAGIRSGAAFVAVMLAGWILVSSNGGGAQPNRKSTQTGLPAAAESSIYLEASRLFLLAGGIFGVLLLLAPEATVGPDGLVPFFATATTTSTSESGAAATAEGVTNDSGFDGFDPVMVYAARMFGASHVPFFVAHYYSAWTETAVSALLYQVAAAAFSLPVDVAIGFFGHDDDENASGTAASGIYYNRPVFKAFAALHAVALLATGRALSIAISTQRRTRRVKKEA